jgi:hypothetical protein
LYFLRNYFYTNTHLLLFQMSTPLGVIYFYIVKLQNHYI